MFKSFFTTATLTFLLFLQTGVLMAHSNTYSKVTMVKPCNFFCNPETSGSNVFQDTSTKQSREEIQAAALKEFENFVKVLKKEGINVQVFADTANPVTPDSIFPNNWVSIHPTGELFLYPMEAENRRLERRDDIVRSIQSPRSSSHYYDFTHYEKEGRYLEGTGSIVVDHQNKKAYACLSSRTDPKILKEFCELSNYTPVVFSAKDEKGVPIYHTNVMMEVGEKTAIVCLDVVRDPKEKRFLRESLEKDGIEVVEITQAQLDHFCGNALEVVSARGELFLVMSQQARDALRRDQVKRLEKNAKILSVDIKTIETYGGGSARCMMLGSFNSKSPQV